VDNVDEGIAKSAHCINWFSDFFMANWQRFSVRENKKSGTGISNPGPVDRRQRIIEVLQFRGEEEKGTKGKAGQDCSLSHVCSQDAAVLIKRKAKDAPQDKSALR